MTDKERLNVYLWLDKHWKEYQRLKADGWPVYESSQMAINITNQYIKEIAPEEIISPRAIEFTCKK